MNPLNDILNLAKRLLGVDDPLTTDLAKINAELTPANERKSVVLEDPKQSLEDIEVLPEYEFVLQAVKEEYPAIFVTGRAGTGKSTLIRFLMEKIRNCAVVAPTALAAINVRGSTIHSFFNIPPRILNPDEVFKPRVRILPVIEVLGALIIDEISMVTPDLIDCINNSLKKARRDFRPFGGIPVIFVGDLLQLPPIVRDAEATRYYSDRYRTPYFFSADVFNETELIPIELTKVFRQTELEFVNILDRIRLNNDHRDSVAKINRDCYRDRVPNDFPSLYLVPTNAAARAINTQKLDEIDEELFTFEAVVAGRFDVSKDRFQAPYNLEIKVGAQVLFVKNNKPLWVNGTLGRIKSIEDDQIRVEIEGKGHTVSVDKAVWEKIEYKYDIGKQKIETEIVGSFKQYPITLGWAITIHKSQGMTLDSVRIDLGNGAFCSGQTYVALSRCRSIDNISLDKPISMRDVKADQMILDFYKRLKPLRDQKKG